MALLALVNYREVTDQRKIDFPAMHHHWTTANLQATDTLSIHRNQAGQQVFSLPKHCTNQYSSLIYQAYLDSIYSIEIEAKGSTDWSLSVPTYACYWVSYSSLVFALAFPYFSSALPPCM